MPFEDPKVGAVGTQQNVYQRRPASGVASPTGWSTCATTTMSRRWAQGGGACVSGRTAVYRRSVVMPVLGNLENEFFLGPALRRR